MNLLSNCMGYLAIVTFLAIAVSIIASMTLNPRYRWMSVLGTAVVLATSVLQWHFWSIVVWAVLLVIDIFLCLMFYFRPGCKDGQEAGENVKTPAAA